MITLLAWVDSKPSRISFILASELFVPTYASMFIHIIPGAAYYKCAFLLCCRPLATPLCYDISAVLQCSAMENETGAAADGREGQLKFLQECFAATAVLSGLADITWVPQGRSPIVVTPRKRKHSSARAQQQLLQLFSNNADDLARVLPFPGWAMVIPTYWSNI